MLRLLGLSFVFTDLNVYNGCNLSMDPNCSTCNLPEIYDWK